MKISRLELVNILKLAQPALGGDKNPVTEMKNFWFDGDSVSAFDDMLGIKITCDQKFDFSGGVLGSKLLGVLENSRAQNVTLSKDDSGALLLKAGAANIRFAVRPIEDWFWNPVFPKGDDHYEISKEFVSGIQSILFSVGNGKISTPDERGVTILQSGGTADLYTTDTLSLSRFSVKTGNKPITAQRVILPTPFCEQLIKLTKAGGTLAFDKAGVYCDTGVIIHNDEKSKEKRQANVLLFSKLVDEGEEPRDFVSVISRHSKKAPAFSIPSKLKLSLDRALVLLSENEPAELAIEDGYLYLQARADQGQWEIDDAIKIEDQAGHPDITVFIDPKLFKRVLDENRSTLTMQKEVLIITGPENFVHILATKN